MSSRAPLTFIVPYILIVTGAIGITASYVLTYDTWQLLQNTSYIPACNLSPILSCGSIMKTAQANIAGIPNSIFGLIAFGMLMTFGVLLAGGAVVRRWVWLLAQAGATIGVLFMHYLFFQAVYNLNTICPWCFVVWMITIPTFWYITVYNLTQKHIRLPTKLATFVSFVMKHHVNILVVWYLCIFGILLQHFWYYWSTLLVF